jgi:dipeptidyl aminopeptidase/acylaminoacyl peptidase
MYRALRDAGVESKLFIAPREPHSFGELRHRLFKINVELAWFEKYVNNRDYEWQAVPKVDEK